MNIDDKPYFADTFAYMMLSTASISGLNKMLNAEEVDLQVEETRFRPNILIEGDFPEFSEDKWPSIKIGDVIFRNIRVCDRQDKIIKDFETRTTFSKLVDAFLQVLIHSLETSIPSRSP